MEEENQSEPEIFLTCREDLKLEQQDGKFILNDPIKNSFTRLGVAEYLVYRCFDGKSTQEDIIRRLKEERDVTLRPDQLERLANQLSGKQLLLKPGEQVTEEAVDLQDGGGFLDKITMIDVGLAHNPDRWLTALFHRIKYICFRPAFFVFFFLMGLLATSIWLSSWPALSAQYSSISFDGVTIALFWFCLTFSLLLHEIGHGVATKGFGGKVPRMGAFFYFFMLAWYCDVSASYMFKSKFRKQMVLMAGPMVTFLLLFLCTIGWRLTVQGGPTNTFFFMMMSVNSGLTIATLDPLFKGDGYFMICTWLEMPNLTQNAHSYVRASIAKHVFRSKTPLPKADERQARIFWRWELIKRPSIFLFFIYFGVGFIVFVTESLGVLSLYLFAIVSYELLGKPLHRLAHGFLRYLSKACRTSDAKLLLQHLASPLKPLFFGLIKPMKFAIPIVLIGLIPYADSTSAPFTIVSTSALDVRSEREGVLVSVEVHQGDVVNAGDVVARLGSDALVAEQRQATAALRELQLALDLVELGARPEEIAVAQSQEQSKALLVSYLRREVNRDKPLHEAGDISDKSFAELRLGLFAAKLRSRASRAQARLVQAGARPEEIEIAKAQVTAQEIRVKEIERKLAATIIRAPRSGEVVSAESDLRARLGQSVEKGESIIQIIDTSSLMARVEFEESQIGLLSDEAPIELRSFIDPQVVQQSRVRSTTRIVSKTSEDKDASRRIHAWAEFRFDGAPFAIGTTGLAKIKTPTRPLYKVVYSKALRTSWVTLWSWL